MDPLLARFATTQFGVFTASQAYVSGWSHAELQRAIRDGRLVRVHRGVYADATAFATLTPERRHLAQARGVQLQQGAAVAWSHATAAIAHGLPLLGSVPDLPEVTVERCERRTASAARLFSAALPEGHTVVIEGARTTSVARTVSDVARHHGVLAAVVAADAALASGRLQPADTDVVLRDCRMWKHIPRTKRAFALMNGAAESPGESISRVRLLEHGVDQPELQVELVIDGRVVRPDFLWRRRRVVGEFDGRVKYAVAEDLFAEKRREDALRRAGWTVVRWTWDELWGDAPAFVRRVQRALASAAA